MIVDFVVDWIFVEGGMVMVVLFLCEDFVDWLLIYCVLIFVGGGCMLGDIGLNDFGEVYDCWIVIDSCCFGSDWFDVYEWLWG